MPNLYETLLIVTPEADDEGVSAVIGDLRATIESDGGTVLQAGVWARRKLAYVVQGKTEGIYVLIRADGERTLPAVLKDRMKLDESVIRFMVVRLEGQQEIDVRQKIAEGDYVTDAAEIEAQRVAAERRHEAEAAAAAMSLDEIVAAEEAEAEAEAKAAHSDEGGTQDDPETAGSNHEMEAEDTSPVASDDSDDSTAEIEAKAAHSDERGTQDDPEATGVNDEAPPGEPPSVDEKEDDVASDDGDADDSDDEEKEGQR
jgi:small subunit ribosomal protein S6